MKGNVLAMLAILAVIACAWVFAINSICVLFCSYDTGWLLQVGHHILSSGVPRQELFSWTNLGKPYVAYQWLFSALISSLYQVGSLWLVGFLACLAVGMLVLFCLPRMWMRRGLPIFLPFLFLCLTLTPNWFNARPQLFSYFFLLAFVLICERVRVSQGASKLAWMLPALMVLWVNLHSFWMFGVLVVCLYAVADTIRHRRVNGSLWIVSLLTLCAPLANPYGTDLFSYLASFMNGSQYLNIWELTPWTISEMAWTLAFLPIFLGPLLARIKVGSGLLKPAELRVSIPAEGYLICLSTFILALLMRRFEPVSVILSWTFIGAALSNFDWAKLSARKFPALQMQASAGRAGWIRKAPLHALCAVVFASGVWAIQCPSEKAAWHLYTAGSCDLLNAFTKTHGRTNLFNDPIIGSYLIGLGYKHVFIDTRFDRYPKEFAYAVDRCLEGQGSLPALDAARAEHAIVHDNTALFVALVESPGWLLALDDGRVSWWVRNDVSGKTEIDGLKLDDDSLRRHQPSQLVTKRLVDATLDLRAAKYLRMANDFGRQGQHKLALDCVNRGLSIFPNSAALKKERANCLSSLNAVDRIQ